MRYYIRLAAYLLLSAFCAAKATADSATLTPLYNFSSNSGNYQNSDGIAPVGLTLGPDGNFYGLAQSGGPNSDGTIFTLHPDGTSFATLHDFDSGDGFLPTGTLTVAADGSLAGAAPNGGVNGTGTLFRLLPDGSQYTSLYTFSAMDSNGFNAVGAIPNPAWRQVPMAHCMGTLGSAGPATQGQYFASTPMAAALQFYTLLRPMTVNRKMSAERFRRRHSL